MTLSDLVRKRTEEIAADYRDRGYTVIVHPASPELPTFLQEYQPDLIARSLKDNVVIDVKPSPALDTKRMARLAKAIEREAGWRFEVAFVNQPVAAEIPAEETLVPDSQVNRLLSSAETLFSEGQVEAAAMLAWSAVEAILRRDAQSSAPEFERQSSARVLKHLYSLGRIEHATYEKLLSLMQFRNAIAHGFAPRTAAPSIPDVIPDIRRLQNAA